MIFIAGRESLYLGAINSKTQILSTMRFGVKVLGIKTNGSLDIYKVTPASYLAKDIFRNF